jgi:hypothetical protein
MKTYKSGAGVKSIESVAKRWKKRRPIIQVIQLNAVKMKIKKSHHLLFMFGMGWKKMIFPPHEADQLNGFCRAGKFQLLK